MIRLIGTACVRYYPVKYCWPGVDDLQAFMAEIDDYGHVISPAAACPLLRTYNARTYIFSCRVVVHVIDDHRRIKS